MKRSTEHTTEVKGPGLARGPAMIIGTILSVAGLALFLHAGDTSTAGFPDGSASGSKILGFESNGWTAWITTAAGVLLLFGAAQHLLAKAMSLIVGVGLAACAVIALIDGDVLGLAAANWAVELAWGIAAVILLLNLFAPRVTHREADDHDAHRHRLRRRHDDDRHVHDGHHEQDEHRERDGERTATAGGDGGRAPRADAPDRGDDRTGQDGEARNAGDAVPGNRTSRVRHGARG